MAGEIAALARSMGRVSGQEEALLEALAGAAERELGAALRPGVTPEDCGDAFPVAGAWLVLAALEVSRGAGQAESFTAGDLTIRAGDSAGRADALRAQARRLLAPWLTDSRFVFYGVKST